MLREILKYQVLSDYVEKGIKGLYCSIKNKEEARTEAMKEKGEDYNKLEFECAYVSSKLDILSIGLCFKKLVENEENRLEIANMLEEIAKEIRNIKIEEGTNE